MIKIQNTQMIRVSDWDDLVVKTYGKPYNFQQQNDCQDRGTYHITVPDDADDFENDTVPEIINGVEMGVSFSAWLEREPNEWNGDPEDKRFVYMFWNRNFYPNIQMVANDLYAKGLLPKDDYVIEIDW